MIPVSPVGPAAPVLPVEPVAQVLPKAYNPVTYLAYLKVEQSPQYTYHLHK
ncbi:hypothetical protein [Bacillus pumilus]|uniref:hypothetical protein n=1 Tax=Bacillus pumilus TaxID=1408 RepID=UPI001B836A37|nr:hypothetical protein [Bacillus pumilus]MBR0619307.1 hypothetical protein [Bacillus pumilus]